ncbi:MAG: hypothetical protein FJ297_12740 [Planctomycetes bacterium]|nr:hypothetical protein [Planctomycetota bacterium]
MGLTLARAPRESNVRRATLFGMAGVFLASLSSLTVVDLDLFHEMALAREAIRIGHLPRTDPFAYTPTVDPVVHHEWGTGIVLYAVCSASGLGSVGLMAFRYAVSFGIGWGALACARRRGAGLALASFLAPLAISLSWMGFTVVRAQLFTLAGLVALLWFLTEAERGRAWWIPAWLIVHVLWLNAHAGFLVGVGLLGLFTVERSVCAWIDRSDPLAARAARIALWAFAATVAAIVVNPYGIAYPAYLWRAVRMPRPLIPEWAPLWQGGSAILLALFAISLLIGIYAAAAGRGGAARGIAFVWLAIPALLAWRHTRHLSLYAAVWICLVPGWLAATRIGDELERLARRRAAWFAVLWAVCGALGIGLAARQRFWELRVPTSARGEREGVPIYPAGAVDYLEANRFAGNLMVPFGAGGFVSWRLFPDVRVSIDSRYEVAYPPGAVEESVFFFSGTADTRAVLARHPTDAILAPVESPILDRLTEPAVEPGSRSDWVIVYRDDAFAVLAPRGAADRFLPADRRGERIIAEFP